MSLSLLRACLVVGLAVASLVRPAEAAPAHALAMHGDPALGPDFDHFPYARADAPKGGRITYGVLGSFDSLNPFIVKGNPARGLRDGGQENFVYESMAVRGYDEPFTLYCLICATMEVPDDRSWIEFTIRPEAAFSDGRPVTAEDVVHSLEILRDRGRPNLAAAYKKVIRTEVADPRRVRFVFADGSDREIALIMALMPILPKHAMSAEQFEATSLTPPIGSGPYVVASVKPGDQLVLKRNPDYWARNLPVKRGFDNYDEIRFDYYRDETSMFEAFKAGLIDIFPDGDASRWSTGYDFPAVADGRVIRDRFESGLPKAMVGLVFNTRRPIFADVRVREALARLYDFEWINSSYYFGLYRRTSSFFEGSELSSVGQPASEVERALLKPYMAEVRPDVLEGTWKPPASDGSGRDRAALKASVDQLALAGWKLKSGVMTNATGEPLRFEVLLQTREQERIALAYQRTLKSIGVDMTVRTLDSAQYQQRRTSFGFDMIVWTWAASLSPGNEQNFRWSSAAAASEGSFNLPGARSQGIDAMIRAMLEARSRPDFVAAVRAFDRLLISGFYIVPLQHQPDIWIARWRRIERPERASLFGPVPAAWWVNPKDVQ